MGTRIENATITLNHTSPDLEDYMLALGISGATDSINITIDELATFMTFVTNKIVQGNSEVNVTDGGTGTINVILDGVNAFSIHAAALTPYANDTFSLGPLTKSIKDLCISGAINVGSDIPGGMYYRNASNKLERLPIGAEGQGLIVNTGVPSWGTTDVDFVPSYFCTQWDNNVTLTTGGLVEAIAAIGGSGGNIYMAGTFIMLNNVSWDLTNVRFYGNGDRKSVV